ncbi:MAG: hypothetical protein Q7J34_10770 [Bacteroidales bacterium]|jgi:DNA gyrase inhibitor GyrI|nr:hypothetical protein [Bacteroidales bacterium]
MRKVLKIAAWFIFVLVAIVAAFFWYAGFFDRTHIEERQMASFYVAFRDHQGSYEQAQSLQNQIFLELVRDSIVPMKAVGIFFDDPSVGRQSSGRYRVGCIISSDNLTRAYASMSGYRIMAIPSARYIITQFPFDNKLSAVAATTKAYHAFAAYRKTRGMKKRPVMEVYDEAAGTITLMTEVVF